MYRKLGSKKEVGVLIKLLGIYIVAVVGYLLYVKNFSIPVHMNVDEELYISMAKSFYYEGNFSKGGMVLDYACVLYSMILSLAYYFYTPENIVFAFRSIGVCIMLTSIFPTYLLSKKMLKNEKHALIFSMFTCIFPSMMNVAYCMQEVLSYPLFLWVMYFVYKEIDTNTIDRITIYTFGTIITSVLCYFTKTYMIFIPIVYCILLFLKAWENKKNIIWEKMFFFCAGYLGLIVLGKQVILYINDGIMGVNHYSSQFSNLFPITWQTIGATISCVLLYFAALVFYWGILPVILPVINWKEHETKDRYVFLFILMSFLILIAEIVVSIVLTEEGNVIFPHKVLYRYFQILEIPLFLMFIKNNGKYKITKIMWGVYTFVLGILLTYYLYIGTRQRTAIIDAPVFLLMENVNRYVIPNFNALVCIISAFFVLVVYLLYAKKKIKNIKSGFIKLIVIGISLFFVVNLIQLPLYTNMIAKGKAIESDGIKIAEFCNENDEEYEKIYFIHTEDLFYERAINAYLEEEIVFLTENEAESMKFEKSVIICSNEYDVKQVSQRVEIDTTTIQVWVVN